jgi:hypothetical protein
MNPHLQKEKRNAFILKIKRLRTYRKAIIIFSVMLNVFLLSKITNSKVERIIEREYYFDQDSVDKVYNLNNYASYADQSSDLGLRFKKIYTAYLKDKDKPKSSFYDTKQQLDNYWERNCINTLRKIHNINSRIEDLETAISIICDGRKDTQKYFDLLVEKQQYKDQLAEMSNFYAKFISNYTYDTITKTID